MNTIIFILHIAVICTLTLMALRCSLELMIAWISLLTITMNLFVMKQITLFGLDVTSSDALAIGYLLGLNLIQEFFGKKMAQRSVAISFFISLSFVILSYIHISYTPNEYDTSQTHFILLLRQVPRIFIASLISFLVVQCIDINFFGFLRKKTNGRFLVGRTVLSLLLSQTLDTFLFSFLGLYGIVNNLGHIIFLSLAIKGSCIACAAPFVSLAKYIRTSHAL